MLYTATLLLYCFVLLTHSNVESNCIQTVHRVGPAESLHPQPAWSIGDSNLWVQLICSLRVRRRTVLHDVSVLCVVCVCIGVSCVSIAHVGVSTCILVICA